MAASTQILNLNPKERIILGLMNFGEDASHGARITSLDEFNKILEYFQGQGFNEVDTARLYVAGTQENFTAKAHWKERGLTLATKWYPFFPGAHRKDVIKAKFEESLNSLKTNYVDIFYLHAPDRSVPFTETLEALNELYKQGKFGKLGLSNFSAFEVAEIVLTCKANGWVRPSVYQGVYNAITRSIDVELFPACRRYGIDIIVYNPLAGGLFSGRYKSADVPADGRFSDASGPLGTQYRNKYFKNSYFEALSIIEPVAAKHQLTLIEIGLRWVKYHSELKVIGGNDGILIGVSSLKQLKSNLTDLEKGPLPEDVVEALDQAWAITKVDAGNYWFFDVKYGYDTEKELFGI